MLSDAYQKLGRGKPGMDQPATKTRTDFTSVLLSGLYVTKPRFLNLGATVIFSLNPE